jgi:hypothetical protein
VAIVQIEKVEEQVGEVLGLEIAAQKAVEEPYLKGVLNKRGIKGKLQGMKSEAAGHQKNIEKLMQRVSELEGLNQDSMQKKQQKRHHK